MVRIILFWKSEYMICLFGTNMVSQITSKLTVYLWAMLFEIKMICYINSTLNTEVKSVCMYNTKKHIFSSYINTQIIYCAINL